MSAAERLPVAILGAGLTGLSAAYHLAAAGVRCRLFDKEARVGGLAVTTEERGFRFDRTGHLLHLQDEGIRRLALDWIGPRHQRIERNSAVFSHGVYTGYPYQANSFGLPAEVAYANVMGFLRAQQEPLPDRTDDFEQFCRTRFGDGISDNFMIPYNTRLWGVPPRQISAAWCERFVPIPTLEDVVAGALKPTERKLGYNTHFIYPDRGIGQLPEGMAAAIQEQGVRIDLGWAPDRIDLTKRELIFARERVPFDTLLSSIPLPLLLRLCDPLPEPVRAAAERLRCTHLCYLDVALRRPPLQPYHWVYVPQPHYPFYRVGCYSHFSRHMAPPGQGCLYVELADRQPPPLKQLLPVVADALIEMRLIPHREAILFARLRRIDHAYVIFDHAYDEALAVIRPFLQQQRILSSGRYGGWNYSSMGDALRFGRDMAVQAISEARVGSHCAGGMSEVDGPRFERSADD